MEEVHVERKKKSARQLCRFDPARSRAGLGARDGGEAAAPPPPVEDPDDPWYGCTPWGPVTYGAECCDYPELIIPCQGPNPPLDPVIIPLEARSEAAAG